MRKIMADRKCWYDAVIVNKEQYEETTDGLDLLDTLLDLFRSDFLKLIKEEGACYVVCGKKKKFIPITDYDAINNWLKG